MEIEYIYNVIRIEDDGKVQFMSEAIDSKESINENYLFLVNDSMSHRDYYCIRDQYVDENITRIKEFMKKLYIY